MHIIGERRSGQHECHCSCILWLVQLSCHRLFKGLIFEIFVISRPGHSQPSILVAVNMQLNEYTLQTLAMLSAFLLAMSLYPDVQANLKQSSIVFWDKRGFQ